MKAYAPIQKAKKAKYLVDYFQENKVEHNAVRQRRRNTPEGRAKYNEYMRNFKKKRKKRAERAQKEIGSEPPDSLPTDN